MMTDFFTRLAQRTLGTANISKPAIAPMFAPTTPISSESSFLAEPVVREQPQLEVFPDTRTLSSHQLQPEITTPPENLPQPQAPGLPEPLVMKEIVPVPGAVSSDNAIVEKVTENTVPPLPPELPTLPPTHPPSTHAQVELEETVSLLPAPEIAITQPPTQFPVKMTTRPIVAPLLVSLAAPEVTQRSPQAEISAPERPEPAPTIRIQINRVEVRAVNTQPRPTPAPPAPPAPRLSLDDYLRTRNGGQK